MKNKKIVLIVIIVLLIVFLPLTVLSVIYKNVGPKGEENPNHEFSYKGYLWFYDENDNFLSKYECLTEVCEYATPIIDDTIYEINYYQEGDIKSIGLIDNAYTFITDGEVLLYDVNRGVKLQGYKAIKNYYTNLANSNYIIQNNNDLWGVLTIGSVLGTVLPFEYDFIGLLDGVNEDGTLNTDKYITLKRGNWQIISNEKIALSSAISYPIVNYNDDYIIAKNENKYKIFDYEGKEYVSNFEISNYYLVDKYIGISNGNVMYVYSDFNNKYLGNANVSNVTGNITLELQNKNILVKDNDNIISTISIN